MLFFWNPRTEKKAIFSSAIWLSFWIKVSEKLIYSMSVWCKVKKTPKYPVRMPFSILFVLWFNRLVFGSVLIFRPLYIHSFNHLLSIWSYKLHSPWLFESCLIVSTDLFESSASWPQTTQHKGDPIYSPVLCRLILTVCTDWMTKPKRRSVCPATTLGVSDCIYIYIPLSRLTPLSRATYI